MDANLFIVIVNFRTPDLVINCLRSLSSQVDALAQGRVIVVDNDSGDRSLETLSTFVGRQGWRSWIEIVPSGRNGGFAFGNNVGIRVARVSATGDDCVLLLNPDTVVYPGAIRSLVDFMQAHPGAGIAGSLLENADGGIECSAHRAPSPLSELDDGARLGLLTRLLKDRAVSSPPRSAAHECDWVCGASLIVRRRVLEQIGPLDEGFFLYFEEVDYCCRAKTAGWSVWFVPESRIVHLEGAATGIHAAKKRRPKYWYDSRRRFFVKHHGIAGLIAADALWALGRWSLLARRLLHLGGRDGNDPKWFMFDLLWGDLRSVLTGQITAIRRSVTGLNNWRQDKA